MSAGRRGLAATAACLWLAVTGAAAAAGGPAKAVRIKLEWELEGLPAGMLTVHEPAGARPLGLWDMGEVLERGLAPAGTLVEDGVVQIRPGGRKKLVLLAANGGERELRFFAAPHHATPAAATLGFKFHCLCVNHVFKVPPKGYWWRVVELVLDREYKGETLRVAHTLVGVDGDRQILDPGMTGAGHHGGTPP